MIQTSSVNTDLELLVGTQTQTFIKLGLAIPLLGLAKE